MTSPSRPSTMRSPSNKTPSPRPYTENAFITQSNAKLSDQIALPTMVTSTSLSAAMPRICQPSPHETASLMEAANAQASLNATGPLTYTADVKQFPDAMECILQPAATQSSQLDSMLLSKLPRELRDKIYRNAVVEDKDVPIHVTRYETEDGEHGRRLQIGHELLRVSKQTRQEVADIYYLENTFRITENLLEKRAIRELCKHLRPWAGKITKLGVSHTIFREQCGLAKINFHISTFQGRVVVEPESSGMDHSNFTLDLGRRRMPGTSNSICFCKVFELSLDYVGCDILSWMQPYVDLVLQPENQFPYISLLDLAHCWTCAGRNVI